MCICGILEDFHCAFLMLIPIVDHNIREIASALSMLSSLYWKLIVVISSADNEKDLWDVPVCFKWSRTVPICAGYFLHHWLMNRNRVFHEWQTREIDLEQVFWWCHGAIKWEPMSSANSNCCYNCWELIIFFLCNLETGQSYEAVYNRLMTQ